MTVIVGMTEVQKEEWRRMIGRNLDEMKYEYIPAIIPKETYVEALKEIEKLKELVEHLEWQLNGYMAQEK